MEIYILHDGKQIGPYSEETVQALLKQGRILINDLAWGPGLTSWGPLHAVLYPAAQPPAAPASALPPPPPAAAGYADEAAEYAALESSVAVEVAVEPATPRQKAFLTYMSVPFTSNLTKDRAVHMVNDAMENPKNSGRLKRWEEDRYRLYPDLFAEEIKARRENRAAQFLEICQGEGSEFFEGVTKAHTQVLVGYLDVHYPTWDETEHAAKYDYFFPAISEKFPQLLKKAAKGRFKYPGGPKVAAELVRGPVAVRARARRSPIGAIVRGIFIGGILLGIAVAAVEANKRGGLEAVKAAIAKASESAKTSPSKPAVTKPVKHEEPADTAATSPKSATPDVSVPAPTVPAPAIAQASPVAPAVPGASATPAPVAPGAAAPPDATMAANTVTPALPSNVSLFDTTPPPAVPPAGDSLTPAPTAPVAPIAPQRVYAKITKPTVINLRFGSSTLRTGTPVQVLSASGSNLTIQFGPETLTIPAANTDYSGPVSSAPISAAP